MRSRIALGMLAVTAAAVAGPAPELGQPLSPDDIAALDMTVLPDGTGLPVGSGSATAGRRVYEEHCLACHGADGSGGSSDALVGGIGSLAGDAPLKTVGSYWPFATTLFDYIRRAMPLPAPGSLDNDEIYAVTAYILQQNGIIAADAELDAQTLPRVRMPNRDNFIEEDVD